MAKQRKQPVPNDDQKDLIEMPDLTGPGKPGTLWAPRQQPGGGRGPGRPDYIKDKQGKEAADAGEELEHLARALSGAKAVKADLEARLREVGQQIEVLETRIVEGMQARGIDLFRVSGIGTVSYKPRNFPSVKDAAAYLEWLDSNAMAAVAPRTTHPSKLASLVTELLEDGQPLPPGVVNFEKMKVHFRSATGKQQ